MHTCKDENNMTKYHHNKGENIMEQKKIYILNGSPRKDWNTSKMCQSFAKGVDDAGGTAEIINLYDVDFKGCRSCFACKLKGGKNYGKCAYPDGLKQVLEKVTYGDGIVFASPIYFGEVTGVMKSFIERLFFPFFKYDENYTTIPPKKLKTAVIYTMNVNEQIFEENYIANGAGPVAFFERWITHVYQEPQRICAYDTFQFTDYDKYDAELWDKNEKQKYREEVFPKDLQKAYEAGKKIIE